MKAIIVEDEILAREELQYLIETYSEIEVTDFFEDGLDVLKFLQDHETDAIFLDINIPSFNGMMLANNISKFEKKPFIIFTTAYKEHAVEAFELEAFDYILSPMMKSGLQRCYRNWSLSISLAKVRKQTKRKKQRRKIRLEYPSVSISVRTKKLLSSM